MRSWFIAVVLLVSASVLPASAQENKADNLSLNNLKTAFLVPRLSHGPMTYKVQAHATFIACVYSEGHCARVAHSRGFSSHYTKHDHDICPQSPGLACYAE